MSNPFSDEEPPVSGKSAKAANVETGGGPRGTGAYEGYRDDRQSAEVVLAERDIRPRGIDIECVCQGALMRVSFPAGVGPGDALDYLRGEDPGVKFKSEFPMKGGFGPKETKLARVLSIDVRVSDSGKFVKLICTAEGEDFTVDVGRNTVETFVSDLKALGKVKEKQLAAVEKAFVEKGTALVVLRTEEEQFGVKYWEKDGRRFSEGFVAEAPEEKK